MSVSKIARPELQERSNHVLARPRELRSTMVKGSVLIGSPHLTKRAPDAGESARFQAFSSPQLFSHSDGVPPSAPARVTQAVSPFLLTALSI
jgi:hypothetical protein